MFGEPPLSEIMKSSLSSRLNGEPVKYSSCVFQPFSSPAHPPTSAFSFNFITMCLLYFLWGDVIAAVAGRLGDPPLPGGRDLVE